MKKPLVQDEFSIKFINAMKLDVHRRANLGDPATHKAVLNQVTAAHNAIAAGIETIEALGGDMTRSEPERHDAGRKVAVRTIEALQKSREGILNTANVMAKAASDAIEAQFAPDPTRAGLESEIRSWLREKSKAGDVAAIKEQIAATPEVAAVIYHTPTFLTGLADDVHDMFRYQAMKYYAYKEVDIINESGELKKLSDNYPKIIASVKTSFYNAAIAQQVKSRVDV